MNFVESKLKILKYAFVPKTTEKKGQFIEKNFINVKSFFICSYRRPPLDAQVRENYQLHSKRGKETLGTRYRTKLYRKKIKCRICYNKI